VEPLTRGLPPPGPRSLCPLSSTEFVEPPPKKIPGVNPPPEKFPGYATALIAYSPGTERQEILHMRFQIFALENKGKGHPITHYQGPRGGVEV
jgi:hypothetical protein